MGMWWSKVLIKRTSNDNKEPTKEFTTVQYVPQQPQSDIPNDTCDPPEPDLPEQLQEDMTDGHNDQTADSTGTPTGILWDRANPQQQGLVLQSDQYKDLLRSNLTDLVQSVCVMPMMPVLRQLDVIDADLQERIELQATQRDMVLRMVSLVEKGPLWRLHGFLRGLAVTKQEYLIGVLGLDPTVYEDPPAPAAVTPTHDAGQKTGVEEEEGGEQVPTGAMPDSEPIKTKGFIRKSGGLLACCGWSGLPSDRED